MNSTQALPNLHLILGGARSGKSRYGESLAQESGADVLYIATAQALDVEMQQRIAQHKLDRPKHWDSIEEPVNLSGVITDSKSPVILVDCLTLWLMNLMENKLDLTTAVDDLINALAMQTGDVILVSNEVSMGVVPMGELSRNYVDELGRLHQKIAQIAGRVTLMVAGIPLKVK